MDYQRLTMFITQWNLTSKRKWGCHSKKGDLTGKNEIVLISPKSKMAGLLKTNNGLTDKIRISWEVNRQLWVSLRYLLDWIGEGKRRGYNMINPTICIHLLFPPCQTTTIKSSSYWENAYLYIYIQLCTYYERSISLYNIYIYI